MHHLGEFLRNALVRSVAANDRGATAAEYALMIILVAFVIIGAVTLLGTTLSSMINVAATGI